MRVAVVHEWLVFKAGAESVFEQILSLFPDADVFSVVNFLNEEDAEFLNGKTCRTTFIQKLPFAKKKYRSYLPLMPLAIEQLDLSGYDLVISSSHAVAKGVITGPNQIHISYIHSPMRYAWDLQHIYLKESSLTKRGLKRFMARLILHYMRIWDCRTANGVDYFLANSDYIARRIHKVYRRKAEVIYPPVHLNEFVPGGTKENYYLAASRFVPYKKIPMIIEAFSRMPDKKLVVIGDGPEATAAKAAAGPNVIIMPHQPRTILIEHMQKARAFIFAAEEDFGIMPVEAQGCGTPVIAYARGGALESVIDGKTGILFREQTPEALIEAVARFETTADSINSTVIRHNAERFSVAVFKAKFREFVDDATKPLSENPVTSSSKASAN